MKLKYLGIIVGILALASVIAKASCPFTVRCSMDGAIMMQEETYYNGIHKSVKFGHTDINGEHHYVVVQCD